MPDISAQVTADWGSVVKGAGVSLPFPSSAELSKINTAVNTFAGYLDGDVSTSDLQNAAVLVTEAVKQFVGNVLVSAGLGVLGGPAGAAIGQLVVGGIGRLIEFFDDDTLEKRRLRDAAHAVTSKFAEDVRNWEASIITNSWYLLAELGGDQAIVGTVATYGWGALSPTDSKKAGDYKTRAEYLLRKWGFQPAEISPSLYDWKHKGIGPNSPGILTWGGMNSYMLWAYGPSGSGDAAGDAEVRIKLMKQRVEAEAKAVAVFQAYVTTLRAIREGAKEAVKAVPPSVLKFRLDHPLSSIRDVGFSVAKTGKSGGIGMGVGLLALLGGAWYFVKRKR